MGEKIFSSHPERDDKVWFIGRNKDWYVPTDAAIGRINKPPLMGEIYVDIYSVRPGTSGAPLITKKGIIGMIIQDSGVEAVALDISTIH